MKNQNNDLEEFINFCLSDGLKEGKPINIFVNLNLKKLWSWIQSYTQKKVEEEIEKCIKLSDEIELKNSTTFEEWKAFKHFRNTLRDLLKEKQNDRYR